ncbi:MAG: DUF3833 domain-containing protein [Halioglobus sp.]
MMQNRLRILRCALGLVCMALLQACTSVSVSDHKQFEPSVDLQAFFDGALTAHGVVKNRPGKIIRTFNADIAACWKQGTGYLVEDFVFDDGEQQRRIWTLAPNGDGTYSGTAGDVVGPGNLTVAGNSVFLDYVLRIPLGDATENQRTIDVRVDDRMYLVSPTVLFNESVLTKFGVKVGSLGLVILRQPQGTHEQARAQCEQQT